MRFFTKEEIEQLKVAEEYFDSSVHYGYKRCSPRTMDEMVADVYEATGGEKIRRNWGCSVCSFNAYKKIGEHYYASIEKLNSKKGRGRGKANETNADKEVVTETEPQLINN